MTQSKPKPLLSRRLLSTSYLVFALLGSGSTIAAQDISNSLLLQDYRPVSYYKVPQTTITKSKFPIIDMHSHAYAESVEEVDEWVRTMDEVGIEKTIVMSYQIGAAFDSVYALYAGRHPGRFEVWCGLDYRGYDEPGYGPDAVAELERCKAVGATGVGELGDKGRGLLYSHSEKAYGLHPDDSRLDPVFEACGRLNMPVAIHVAEPIWMYLPMDSTNDGLMNAHDWRIDEDPNVVDHQGMIDIFENTVRKHNGTTFIAVHFANLSYDLSQLGRLLDKYPNLYADNAARYAETATIPNFTAQFINKYKSRIIYGTDMGFDKDMYMVTFRLLESQDEHFYESDQFGYHWALNGLGLKDGVLQKLYRTNALKILGSN